MVFFLEGALLPSWIGKALTSLINVRVTTNYFLPFSSFTTTNVAQRRCKEVGFGSHAHTHLPMHACTHNYTHTHTQRLLAPSSKLVPLVVFSVSAKGGEGKGGKNTPRMKFLFSDKDHISISVWFSLDSIDLSFWRPRIVVVEWLALTALGQETPNSNPAVAKLFS